MAHRFVYANRGQTMAHSQSRTSDSVHAGPATQGGKSARAGATGSGTLEPALLEGFCHLLGAPKPGQASGLPADLASARPLLAALAAALPLASSPDAAATGPHPLWRAPLPAKHGRKPNIDDNPTIPAGYTYLLQFVAHDLVQSTVPFWAAAESGTGSRNMRRGGLQLDTLYGGGPATCPVAYQTAGHVADDRYLLRLGRMQPNPSMPAAQGQCPFRDLARVNVIAGLPAGSDPRDSVNLPYANQTLTADPRNDDGIILAQLTVLFSIAHNVIARAVASDEPEAKFAHARAALRHIYYRVIADDLLPRLLHPEVRKQIAQRPADDPAWLWHGGDIPLEFSHGAFRVGHAMVRSRYALKAGGGDKLDIVSIVTGNRASADSRKPLPASWVVQWSRFFDDLGNEPNYSRRIGPTQSRLDHEGLFVNRNATNADGMTLRDMLGASLARNWSVDALIGTLHAKRPDLFPAGWPLLDPAARHAAIAGWLNGVLARPNTPVASKAALSGQVPRLAADLPLPLFILLEAALDPAVEGRHLGVLGSIIVGEVIGRCLARERERLAPLAANAAAALAAGGLWAEIAAIGNMPDFVRFVASHGGMQDCRDAPFI